MSIQLKYKKLKYEIKYLTAEKEELVALLSEVLPKFENEFRKLVPEFEKVNERVKKESRKKSKKEITNEPNKSNSVKKVYRRIVTRTHPDKLEQLPNTHLKKGLIKKYKEAVNSYKNNDIVSLFDLADELDIKLPEIDESHINSMITQTDALKNQINAYRNSNAIIWYKSEDRDKTMNQIVEKLKQAGRI
tara:strand:+ start:96 stop:665 length:570 start_codon:yes stop_codon:yes gene_type:complete